MFRYYKNENYEFIFLTTICGRIKIHYLDRNLKLFYKTIFNITTTVGIFYT